MASLFGTPILYQSTPSIFSATCTFGRCLPELPPEPGSLLDMLISDGRFTIFVDLIRLGGFAPRLGSNDFQSTVFAVADENIGPEFRTILWNLTASNAREIAGFHILPQAFGLYQLCEFSSHSLSGGLLLRTLHPTDSLQLVLPLDPFSHSSHHHSHEREEEEEEERDPRAPPKVIDGDMWASTRDCEGRLARNGVIHIFNKLAVPPSFVPSGDCF